MTPRFEELRRAAIVARWLAKWRSGGDSWLPCRRRPPPASSRRPAPDCRGHRACNPEQRGMASHGRDLERLPRRRCGRAGHKGTAEEAERAMGCFECSLHGSDYLNAKPRGAKGRPPSDNGRLTETIGGWVWQSLPDSGASRSSYLGQDVSRVNGQKTESSFCFSGGWTCVAPAESVNSFAAPPPAATRTQGAPAMPRSKVCSCR